jgi:hypothetical protein
MKRFPSVEDYIEVMNGDRNPETGKIYDLFSSTPPIVSLARYDVQILGSMSSTTQSGRALTDRQAELAVKLVLKYRRQLEKLDIDVAPIESPTFRLGIRQIDRRRLLYIDGNTVVLKFPYDTTLINDLRDLSKISQGRWKFDSTNRSWALAITETNVVAANGFAQNHQFEIAPEFARYIQAIDTCEQQPYEIKLVEQNGSLTITNAANTLLEAIHNWCGFDRSNLDLLVDAAPVFGYTVDELLSLDIAVKYGSRVANLMTTQETKFAPTSDETVFQDLIRYADIANRYPIYVYEPDMTDRLYKNFVAKFFEEKYIFRTQNLKKSNTAANAKVIYFNKYTAAWNQPIRLLVSGQGMMHGGDKTILLQNAEKVVYFATEVYNANTMKRKN